MERGGDGVALGIAIKPGRRAAEGEERIEVADRAGADVFLRDRGEGEIEEDDLEGVIAADAADGDVVGLDVAVGDPLLLEMADDVDEVFAEALEELDVEAALLADPAGEGLDPLVVGVGEHRPHEEAGMVADRHFLHEGDDPRVAVLRQGAKRGRFGTEPVGMVGEEGDFEDQLLAGGVAAREGAGDEERRRAGALADAALDFETAGEEVAGHRLGGVVGVVLDGAREVVFGLVEVFEEVGDALEAARDVGVGGELN